MGWDYLSATNVTIALTNKNLFPALGEI